MSEAQEIQPQPETLCLYCEKNPAEAECAYMVPLSRPASSPEGDQPANAPETQAVAVPRCASCAAIHQRLHKIRRISMIVIFGVGFGGGLLMNLFLFRFQLTHPGGILFAVILSAGGLTYLVLAQRFGNPNQIRAAQSALDLYPPIQSLKEEGWKA